MGSIIDILKEIPLSAVLKERLIDQERKMATLEKENAELRIRIHKLEEDKEVQGDLCPYCRKPKGELLKLEADPVFGPMGVKKGYYKCSNCAREYDRQINPNR